MTYTHNSSYSKFEQNNTGKFVKIAKDSNVEVGIDFRNIISEPNQITFVTASSTSTGVTLTRELAVRDKDIRNLPHQAVVFIQPTALGVHNIKVEAKTNDNETYVYRFDVLTER